MSESIIMRPALGKFARVRDENWLYRFTGASEVG